METILQASFLPDLQSVGSPERALTLIAKPGEAIYINGAPSRNALFFQTLCGLRKPDAGTVALCGIDPYGLTPAQGAAFRQAYIGAIPENPGWIPELSLLEQITLPLKMAGMGRDEIRQRVQSMTSEMLPLHSLYNRPGQCTLRKQTHAALVRGMICKPKLLVCNGFLDALPETDAEILWQAFRQLRPKDGVTIYLSGAPAPNQADWTQVLQV